MKGHSPLLWQKPDPSHYRFALPNAVWWYKLRPAAFVILAYLCCRCAHGGSALTPEAIANGVHLKPATVRKYLSALRENGLVIGVCSLAADFLKTDRGNYFTLPNEIFLLSLSRTAFVVYAYLLYIEDRRAHQCHPSYNTIAAGTGFSKNTAMKCVSELLDAGLISMELSYYFDSRGMKWKGNNLYTILPVRCAVDEFHQRQLRQAEREIALRKAQQRQEQLDHRRPKPAV